MVEWTYHKTMDNEHPDDIEQQLLWLTNRARANPSQEGQWLATVDDPYIDMARSYFGVDLALLQDEFASYAVKPPAAFDVRLHNAANSVGTSYGRTASFHNTFSEPAMPQTPSGGGSGGGCYITAIMGCSAANYASYHLIILFALPFSVLFGRFLWNYIKPAV